MNDQTAAISKKLSDEMTPAFAPNEAVAERVGELTVHTVPGAVCPVQVRKLPYQHTMKLPSHRPSDFSDIGQANVFCAEYGDIIRWSPERKGFFVYDGRVWVKSDEKARSILQGMTALQQNEAAKARSDAETQKQKAESTGNKAMQENARRQYDDAVEWFKFVLARRNSNRVTNALKEAAPKIAVDINKLDADPAMLNTPSGTVNLRTGALQDFNPADLCTKMTGVGPDSGGSEIFARFLAKLTSGDAELESYLQEVVGMCAYGEVKTECLIICQGAGGNGKSTFWDLIVRVLGDYATVLEVNALTTSVNDSTAAVYKAELHGRRLALYPELSEGRTLNMGLVKEIASTGDISACRKYEAPFQFKPSHTPVMYTNHVPTIPSTDNGTWDRLILVPFRARFRNSDGEIKNYAEFLYQNCGGAVLSWIIEGARRFISNDFKIIPPACVREVTEQYHQENDLFREFLLAMCEVGNGYEVSSTALYNRLLSYSDAARDKYPSIGKFAVAYRSAGFASKHSKRGNVIVGVRLKQDAGFAQVDMKTPFDSMV